jgi:hypothetical protein
LAASDLEANPCPSKRAATRPAIPQDVGTAATKTAAFDLIGFQKQKPLRFGDGFFKRDALLELFVDAQKSDSYGNDSDAKPDYK